MPRGALSTPPPGFDDLSTDEKVDYVQALWDRIADRPEAVPVPSWHHDVLAERLASYRQDPHGLTLEESRTEVDEKLGEKRTGSEIASATSCTRPLRGFETGLKASRS